MAVSLAATLAVCAVLSLLASGCASLPRPMAEMPAKASETARLRALPDAAEAAIAAPIFYREALETVSFWQAEAEKANVNASFRK